MKRSVVALLCVLLLAVPLFGAQAQDEEPIRIGLVTDLSGWLSIYGVEQVNGFQLGLLYAAGVDPSEYESLEEALDAVRVAGRPVEIIVRDYGSENPAADADNAAAAARELIEAEFVDILFGTPNSGAAVQLQQITSPDDFNMVFMAGPAASPTLTGANFNVNTFRVCRNTLQDAGSLATQLDQFGESFAVMAVDTDFGRGTAGAFELAFGAAGAEKARDTILFPTDTVDFTPFLQQLMDSGAETGILVFAGVNSVALFQQVFELGVLDTMTLATGTNSNDIVAAAPTLENSIAYIVYNYTLPDTEVNDWMIEKHIELFDDVPDLFTECSFATAQALVAGLEATGGDPFPEAMIPALEGLTWEGPKGTYTLRASDHQALANQYVIRFLGLQETEIKDGVTLVLPQYELIADISPEDSAPPCLLQGDFAERCEMDMAGE